MIRKNGFCSLHRFFTFTGSQTITCSYFNVLFITSQVFINVNSIRFMAPSMSTRAEVWPSMSTSHRSHSAQTSMDQVMLIILVQRPATYAGVLYHHLSWYQHPYQNPHCWKKSIAFTITAIPNPTSYEASNSAPASAATSNVTPTIIVVTLAILVTSTITRAACKSAEDWSKTFFSQNRSVEDRSLSTFSNAFDSSPTLKRDLWAVQSGQRCEQSQPLRIAQSTCRSFAVIKCHIGMIDAYERLGLLLAGP